MIKWTETMEGEAERNRKKSKFMLKKKGWQHCHLDAKKTSSDSTGLQCERNC